MEKPRVFISFDFDHDDGLKTMLVGQAEHSDTPFELVDLSIKEHLIGDWKAKARARIRSVDQVVVLCGEYTHTASGVATELTIAREERKPYFLLWGYPNRNCTKPTSAFESDKIYNWTWDNLKALIGGDR